MTFTKLAQYFEKLEATTKRLELVDILARLFVEAGQDEIGKICYLIQGRVAPKFEPTEIGMGQNLVADAIGKSFSKSKEGVLKIYRQKGNMGLAARHLAEIKKQKKESKVSVTEVFEDLFKISQFSGLGTVKKKVSTLSNLLLGLDPVSCKHVVNIPLGTLRLGVGDPTVLDALSIAKKGDKSLRPILEDAYNKTSDLGYAAEIFWSKGETGIKHIQLVVGKPIRPALAERLPNAAEVIKRVGGEFAAEPKFDGFRVQGHKDGKNVQLYSRNLENTTNAFPDLVAGIKDEVRAKSAILEGETLAYNPQTQEFLPFQETSKRRRKHQIEEMAVKLPLVLFAFDLLYLNGKDITRESYQDRRKKLQQIISKDNKVVRLAEERILHTSDDIMNFFNEAVSEGLEGLMIKKLDAPYQAGGRGFHWIKFKRGQGGELTDTVDCVLLGIYGGRGKRTAFGVGGLLVGVYDEKRDEFVTISKIGTGLTDDEWKKIRQMADEIKVDHKPARVRAELEPSFWVEPKIVLEIFADEITRSPVHTAGKKDSEPGYALRFPRLVSFRTEDKRPEDATIVKEIEKMYQQQFKKSKK